MSAARLLALPRRAVARQLQVWRVSLGLLVALSWAACSMADVTRPADIEPGKSFSLKAGQFARLRGTSIQVGFEGVSADSRCPKGEQCVWAGDATVRVWLQQGAGPKETRELHTAANLAQSAAGHEVRLERLEPYPVSGRPLKKGDYTVSLSSRPSTKALIER